MSAIIQVSPTIRKKKKGTPVYSGGVVSCTSAAIQRKVSVASALDGLSQLSKTSVFDEQVDKLRRLWKL